MGMYTELIFGAALKKDTPNTVIQALKYMLGERDKPLDFPLPEGRCEWLFLGTSYYFGVSTCVNKLYYDNIGENYILSTRSNIKNYNNEIEIFLDWVKPYIEYGSGTKNMYAIVMYEEQETPTIYYLN